MGITKETLLEWLLAHPGEDCSGQTLAQQLGVSRAAVNKAAAALKEEGWQITAIPRRGYRLEEGSDALTPQAIRAFFPGECPFPQVLVYPSVGSTNEVLKQLAAQGAPHGTLVVAGEQTAGKGRRGRQFVSPPGGVYFSLLLRPALAASQAVAVTGSAAVAVRRGVKDLCGKDLDIKWVNDLYYQGKKVCGILTEAATDFESGQLDYVIPGIGINISTRPQEFGPQVSQIATSLYPTGHSPVSRAALAAAVASRLLEMCPTFDYLEEYRAACFVPGHWVTVQAAGQDPYIAQALSIDDQGQLVIRLQDGGITALGYGEVSIRPAPLDR